MRYVHRDGTDREGRGAQGGHLDFHTNPELRKSATIMMIWGLVSCVTVNTMVLCLLRLSLTAGIIWFLTVLANCGSHLVYDRPHSGGSVDQWAKNNKPPLNKEVITFCVLNAQVLSKRTDDGDFCSAWGDDASW